MNSLIEVPTASLSCQRWHDRRHSFRPAGAPFDPSRYSVEAIAEADAKRYVVTNHYSGSYPAAKFRYGLFDAGALVGVMVLGIPVQTKAVSIPFPDLEPLVESLELSRFVLDDACPGNSETWFMARCFEAAALSGVRGIVSFADPVPRIIAGKVLFPGHIGTIYQAKSALASGRSTARTLVLLPSGEVLNARSQQKVRAQERGHEHVEAKLMSFGARAPRAGERPAAWLAQALDDIGVRRLRHNGCHRYLFALGTPAQRRRVLIDALPTTYPKQRDAA